MAKRVLVIGYGNPYRRDDGVGWQVVERLEQDSTLAETADFRRTHQLVIEMAEDLAAYETIVFIDAHTSEQKEPVHLEPLEPRAGVMPSTHHLGPGALLRLSHVLYGGNATGWLLSVRGTDFSHGDELTPEARSGVEEAVRLARNLVMARDKG